MKKFADLFQQFQNIKVGVIGDVMLDTYMWGHVERISPEAPVPIVSLDSKHYRIGGRGNVERTVGPPGSEVFFFSVLGDDKDALQLQDLLTGSSIQVEYLLKS